MADQNVSLLALSLKATAAISKYRFVNLAGTHAGAGLYALGVSKFKAAIGETVSYDAIGTGVVECGGTVTAGDIVQSDSVGRAVTKTTGIGLARALESGTVGKPIEVLLMGTNETPIGTVAKVALNAVDTAGGVFSFSPGVAVLVTRVVLDITTASSGACTIDVGVAANATTLNDTLMDGQSLAAIAVLDNIENQGTNGVATRKLSSTQFVTGSVASGASAGVVGFAYIYYNGV
jgi:hypothetical protein